ncbi:MAG: cytosine deaminase [Pseudomonadota bacterium]
MPTRAERIAELSRAARAGRWRLANLRLPAACLLPGHGLRAGRDDLVCADLILEGGRIAGIEAPGQDSENPSVDLAGRIAFPGFVDCHTHLDKGHIWRRTPNPDGTFDGAIATTWRDKERFWTPEDLRARIDFALRAAHAHGTVAIRSHLDLSGDNLETLLPLFREIASDWQGRIALQPAALLGTAEADDPALLDRIARALKDIPGAVLGAFARAFLDDQPDLPHRLEALIRTAERHGLPLDFHVDETTDPNSRGFLMVAEAIRATGFQGPVLCGHCCAPATYDADLLARTLDLAAGTGISVVSLPLCNAYLLDRAAHATPRMRAVAPVHEIRAAGIPVAFGSDNTRDPFNAYGDLDLFEVYRFATWMQHLDHPVGDWPASVTATPARIIGADAGRIAPGAKADLVLFDARGQDELIARPHTDRIVVRDGLPIDPPLPDYAELDGLEGLDDLSD